MKYYKELKYHFKITKELFNIKEQFLKEVDEEIYLYQAKIYDYIIFSEDGNISYSNNPIGIPWYFPTETNKKNMHNELEIAFDCKNEWLSELYHKQLVEVNLLHEESEIPILKWNETDKLEVKHGLNEVSEWLIGHTDCITFRNEFICPVAINAEYNFLLSILSDIDSDELLSIFLEARTGSESKDLLPYNIILAFEQLEEWLQEN